MTVDPDARVSGCLYATGYKGTEDSPEVLSTVDAFDYDNWYLAAKDNDLNGSDEGPVQAALDVVGDTKDGKFTIDNSLLPGVADVVFSVSKGNEAFWYLITLATGSATTGVYMSGFANKSNKIQDISHVSLLTPSAVPIPAALPLLASGLAGLGLMSLQRHRRGAKRD